MMRIIYTMTVALMLLLSACSILPKSAPPPKRHDLGPPTTNQQAQTSLPGKVRLAGVDAAGWLNGTSIYYRNLNADPTRLLSYARNQWLVPPATLIANRLSNIFGTAGQNGSRTAPYRVRLRLEDLEQDFQGPQRAHTLLRVRAAVSGNDLSAAKTFTINQPTQPNINGAIRGTKAAVDKLSVELIAWIRTQAAKR